MQGFCRKWGLKYRDAAEVLGGYRGLFALAFGSNLVQCPSFERIHHSDSPGDRDAYYESGPFRPSAKLLVERIMGLGESDQEYSARSHWGADGDGEQGIFARGGINSLYRTQVTGQFQQPGPAPHHDVSCNCSCAVTGSMPSTATAPAAVPEAAPHMESTGAFLREDHPGAPSDIPADHAHASGARGSNSVEGASVIVSEAEEEGASDAETESGGLPAGALSPSEPAMVVKDGPGLIEGVPGACPRTAAMLKPPATGSDAVCTSSCTWGRLKQAISLRHFSPAFLDNCPPLHLSAWCASNGSRCEHASGSDGSGQFRMQIIMLGCDKQPIYHWYGP